MSVEIVAPGLDVTKTPDSLAVDRVVSTLAPPTEQKSTEIILAHHVNAFG